MSEPAPLVGVLVGSAAELPLMQQATAILEKLELPHEIRVMSSSRSPDLVDEYARTAFDRGLKALVCTTGISGPPRGRGRGPDDRAGDRRADRHRSDGRRAGAVRDRADAERRAGRDGRRRLGDERGGARRRDRRVSPTPTCRSGCGGSRTTSRRASGCDRTRPRPPRTMIERYVLPEMGAVWSDEARLGHWLEIEILVAEALAGLGVVPDADAREIRAKASFDGGARRRGRARHQARRGRVRAGRRRRRSGRRAAGCTSA